MSWKVEFQSTWMNDDRWDGDALRFNTQDEARRYGFDLMARWLMVRDIRTVESVDLVTHAWVEGVATPLGGLMATISAEGS